MEIKKIFTRQKIKNKIHLLVVQNKNNKRKFVIHIISYEYQKMHCLLHLKKKNFFSKYFSFIFDEFFQFFYNCMYIVEKNDNTDNIVYIFFCILQ